jgi:hypothetical protein
MIIAEAVQNNPSTIMTVSGRELERNARSMIIALIEEAYELDGYFSVEIDHERKYEVEITPEMLKDDAEMLRQVGINEDTVVEPLEKENCYHMGMENVLQCYRIGMETVFLSYVDPFQITEQE